MFFRKQKPAGNDNAQEPSTTATASPPEISTASAERTDPETSNVLQGTTITGNIDCDGDLVIDGTVRGSVRAQRLTIGGEGLVEGDVSADNLRVGGRIKGPIHTRHLHLEDGAVVEGDITTETIAIDTGARLSGAVWQGQQPQQQTERYSPVSASSWESGLGEGSRLNAIRARLGETGR